MLAPAATTYGVAEQSAAPRDAANQWNSRGELARSPTPKTNDRKDAAAAASEEDDAGYSTRFVIDVVITVILILATYSLVHPAFDNDDLHQCFSTADGDMNCANMGHHW